MPDNYTINYTNLPYKVFGFTIYNGEEDFYSIFVNIRHSYAEQMKTIKHELNHIINGDCREFVRVNDIEYIR